ncbi:MAG: hypothetical protein IKG14_00815 [Clostridia bacterium]|nr:hypothetical protein [Clostridia bacterium]MBR3324577.1 hypothetical protein [Clostridia bacterium]
MNSKKVMKIISVLLIITAITMAVSTVFGADIPSGDTGKASPLSNATTGIIGIVQYICYAAAVILLVILGVRFMTASPEGKAEIKKSAIIYVIGAVLVFAAGLILGLIVNTATPVLS